MHYKAIFYVTKAVMVSYGLVAFAVPLGAMASPAAAQTLHVTPPVSVPSAQNTVSFIKALDALARRYQIALIAEDESFSDNVPAAVLDEALQSGDAQNAVERIAIAFDYSSTRQGVAFLLQKRFTTFSPDKGEMPSVTLEECLFTLRDTERIVEALNPHINDSNNDDLCGHLMASLTQDQLSAMYNGNRNVGNTVDGKPPRGVSLDGVPLPGDQQKSSKGTVELGLPVRSLTPAQRADVFRIAAYYYVQAPMDRIADEARPYKALLDPTVVFRLEKTQVPGNTAAFGLGCVVSGRKTEKKEWYTLTARADTVNGKTPLANADFMDFYKRYDIVGPWPYTGAPLNTAATEAFFAQAKAQDDAADAVGRKATEEARKRRGKSTAQSLTQIADWLNHRPTPSGLAARNVRAAVDPALSAKRVMLVGVDTLDNLSVWTNVARLYDLATVQQKDGVVLLTIPRVKAARTFTEVPEMMRRVLPRPLRSFAAPGLEQTSSAHERQEALQEIAFNRFCVAALEKASASPKGEFRMNDLDTESKQYLGLMLIGASGIRTISRLAQPVPPFIANFDDRLLIGGLYIAPDGKTKFSLTFAKEESPGVLVQGPGFGGVLYKH